MLKKLYLPNFAIKFFLEENLLALKVNISNIEPPIRKGTVFIRSILTLIDGKQLEMLKVKISGKTEGLFTV